MINWKMRLLVKKLDSNAVMPSYGSEFAAGLDLSANGNYVVKAGERSKINTGLCIEWIGENDAENEREYYLRIAPRSGLAAKFSIDLGAGVVDWDYRGELCVCFVNNSKNDYVINHGDRIAQGILERIKRFNSIEEVTDLGNTIRGVGGFGSTGK